MKLRSLILLALLLSLATLHAQSTDWFYYTSNHGSNLPSFTKVDGTGAAITAVEFSGNITVDGVTYNAAGGNEDILLIKLTPAGAVDWAKHITSGDDLAIGSLAIDTQDRIYLHFIVSGFATTVLADDTLLTVTSNQPRGLLIRVSPTGDVDRAKVGFTGSSITVKGTVIYAISSQTAGAELQKLNINLQLFATFPLGILEMQYPVIAVNAAGYIAIAGSEFMLDNMDIQGTVVPNDPTNKNEAFVFVLDPAGNLQWVRSYGSMNLFSERAYGIALADDGRVFVATGSDVTFTFAGSSFPGNATYAADIGLLLAYSSTGAEDYAIPSYTSSYSSTFRDVIIDSDGNTVATAYTVGSGLVNGTPVTSPSQVYVSVLLKLDPLGNMTMFHQPILANVNTMSAVATGLGQGPDGAYYLGGYGYFFNVNCTPTSPNLVNWRYYVQRIVEQGPVLPQAAFSWSHNGLEVTFANGSSNATTSAWDFGDGATSADPDPTHIYGAQGIYDVVLTATFGICTDTALVQVILLTTGTAEHAAEVDLALFPNPAAGEVRLRSSAPVLGIQVVDVTGRMVDIPLAGTNSSELVLDVNGVAPGRYTVSIHTTTGTLVRGLVVE